MLFNIDASPIIKPHNSLTISHHRIGRHKAAIPRGIVIDSSIIVEICCIIVNGLYLYFADIGFSSLNN
jgi:hypothetical protein